MKRQEPPLDESASKRLRDDSESGRRRLSQEEQLSPREQLPGSSREEPRYVGRGRGYHSAGRGGNGDRERRGSYDSDLGGGGGYVSGGSGNGNGGHRNVERLRRDPEGGEHSPRSGGSSPANSRFRGEEREFERRGSDGSGGSDGSHRGGFDRRGRGGGSFRGGNGDRGFRGGGRGRGDGRGRGGRGRGARRDRHAEELQRHDLVVSHPHPERTKTGTQGSLVEMFSNYFQVRRRPNWCIHHYRVDFLPDEERTFVKKQLFREHRPKFGAHIFDGGSLYVWSPLSEELLELYSIGGHDEQRIKITLKHVGEILPTESQYIQVLNIILRTCLAQMGLEEMGRNFYDNKQAIRLNQQKLELWPGFKTTIRHHEKDVLLGVEITHKVLRTDSCLTVIQDSMRQGRDFKRSLGKDIIGCIVMTIYNRKTYKIDDIDWDQTPQNKFDSNGEETTIANYMYTKYNLRVSDPNQPLLVSRPKKRDMHRGMTGPILLVPEFCQMTGLTDAMRDDHRFMMVVNKHLHLEPHQRFEAVKKFITQLTSTQTIRDEMERWGLRLNPNLIKVNARTLPKNYGAIVTKNNQSFVPGAADWTDHLKGSHMTKSINLIDWVMICPSREKQNLDKILSTMIMVARKMDFIISNPKEIIQLRDVNSTSYFQAVSQAVSTHGPQLQMIFAILVNNRMDNYQAVKKRCCVDFAIPSQCFLVRNVQKNLMSICSKVVIQMNAKLGGEPWNVANLPPNTMIVGFDVYHCGKRKEDSFGATVASVNATMSSFYSTVSPHKSKDELSGNMGVDMTKCLSAYKHRNEKLPERILIYRDGVGEGQLQFVYSTELEQIKNAIKTVYGESNFPKLAFIVVTKKINTRLFCPESNRVGNPPPGTLVDDVITLPERYDFFLISQSVRLGSVSPTSYNVLCDTTGFSPDNMQKLTYKLTHMYYNASATVAVPAPCQYAHKLAYLTGAILKTPGDEKLADKLYYL